jgi:anthranilate phosphoribosyltransferase
MLQECRKQVDAGVDLTEAQAGEALEAILSSDSTDEEIAAFLVALSEKGESAEEIAGFSRVLRRHAITVNSRHESLVDTAGTGGGPSTFNVSTAAALVICGAGVPVAKHGNRAITSKSGSADVLQELGVNIDRPVEVCEKALDEIGLCFMFAPLFHPAMKRVARIRKELGRRTVFNMIGPLTNPASAPYQLIGVYAEDLVEKLALAIARLGCRKAWVVHGKDGMDEISIATETRVVEVTREGIKAFDFKPLVRQVGIPVGGTPAESARLIKGILGGDLTGPARDVVVINAAAAIHLVTGVHLSQAIHQAEESIQSGAALEKLRQLVNVYSE